MSEGLRILTAWWAEPDTVWITRYVQTGGYKGLRKALTMTPQEVIDEVKASGLRGRGGAGFPTGVKWSFVPQDTGKPTYLVANFDESEPGTYNNRELVERDPHQFLEGVIIASYAVQCHTAFIYNRGEFLFPGRVLERAIAEAYDSGFLGKDILKSGYRLDVVLHKGAGAYICGEETALLSSLEGYRGQPRLRPPFPAVEGLYASPTAINNVETLCNVPPLLLNGATWFTKVGTEKSPGTMLFSLSGAVNRPGVYELPMGTPIRTLIDECGGGVLNGRKVKAVFPGGPSFAMLTPDQLDTPMDFESLKHAGTGLGSAGVIVVDDQTCMVATALKYGNFFKVESCGQCPPCRMGTINMADLLQKIEDGDGTEKDLASLLQLCGFVKGRGYCTVVTGASVVVESSLRTFRHEFEAHVAQKRCPFQPAAVAGGVA